ncbi:MAG TPA: hypothetical protein P5531_10535 [Bacteroidales bacterium]|nr:hypothetical protein [Bacteroidales bacterium]HSA43601.1 hypothetical protein [Bacteroidales bacterium]
MTEKEQIRAAVRKIVEDMIPVPFAWATVESVDEQQSTAVCKDSLTSLEYFDVLLGLGSIIQKPVIGTRVLLGLTSHNGEAAFIIWCEEVKDYLISLQSGFKVQIKKDGTMTINGDGCGGLVIVDKNVERINAIEQDINALKQVFTTWVPVTQDGGAALKAAAGSWFAQVLQLTKVSDIENNKISHGK